MFILAIDGPAGSGKSTTARGAAHELGFWHLDTGAMYRAITLLAFRGHADPTDEAAVAEIARSADIRFEPKSSLDHQKQRIFVNGEDLTDEIRSALVSAAVSQVSALPEVRAALVEKQRAFAEGAPGVVAEGRDIGTVVFPNADLKVYLDASIEERARRRAKELQAAGVETTFEEQRSQISRRDETDSAREASPLREASDAVHLDTTGLTIAGQVSEVVRLALERMKAKAEGRDTEL